MPGTTGWATTKRVLRRNTNYVVQQMGLAEKIYPVLISPAVTGASKLYQLTDAFLNLTPYLVNVTMDNLTKHGSEVADNIAAQSGHDVLTSFQPGMSLRQALQPEQALNTTQIC